MKEPYIEGIANHDDPESCAGVRKGPDEALTGARMGGVWSREIGQSGVPRSLSDPKATRTGCASASAGPAPR